MPLSDTDLISLRHPKETPRFYLTLIVLIPLGFVFAAVVTVSFGAVLLVVPAVLLVLWFSLKMFVASYMNNTVLVSDRNFPEVHAAIEDAKYYFGYSGRVDGYVFQDGTYNISFLPLLNTKVLLLNSELLLADNDKNEMRFLVGRFVGALAAKHFRFAWMQAVLDGVEKLIVFNILLYPYERALKLSADRMGLVMIDGDVQSAVRAMMKLMVGADIADRVSVSAFIEQGKQQNGNLFAWLVKAMSPFPHHTTRISEMVSYAKRNYPERFRPSASARRR